VVEAAAALEALEVAEDTTLAGAEVAEDTTLAVAEVAEAAELSITAADDEAAAITGILPEEPAAWATMIPDWVEAAAAPELMILLRMEAALEVAEATMEEIADEPIDDGR